MGIVWEQKRNLMSIGGVSCIIEFGTHTNYRELLMTPLTNSYNHNNLMRLEDPPTDLLLALDI